MITQEIANISPILRLSSYWLSDPNWTAQSDRVKISNNKYLYLTNQG